jgi:hypothetical protein
MSAEAWTRTLRWTSDRERAAARIADARLTEALVHHVDRGAGYRPGDWPTEFGRPPTAAAVSLLSEALTLK